MKKNEQINIFNILSVADKELTHSAVIKLIIEHDNSFLEQFGIINNSTVETEKSYKYGTNKTIRFDIIGFNKSDHPNCISFIIENKFKATPTISQLKIYDDFFIENKNPPKKILMVYFAEQIPTDVSYYCIREDWIIFPYFSANSNYSSFLKYLQHSIKPSSFSCKVKFIMSEYIDYLAGSWNTLCEKIQSEYLFVKKDFDETNSSFDRNRDIWFRYLMHIQSLISNEINPSIKFQSTNDGGSRHIPSVVFWFENGAYFAIDGDRVKLGILYNFSNHQKVKSIQDNFSKDSSLINQILEQNKNCKINKSIPKTKTKQDNNSVITLISYNFVKGKNKAEFVKTNGKVLNNYYNYIDSEIKK